MPAHAKDRTWHRLRSPVVDKDGTVWTHWCEWDGQPVLMRSRYERHAAPFPAQTRWGYFASI